MGLEPSVLTTGVLASLERGGCVSMPAASAAAILEQLLDKGVQVLNLLALCRTPEFNSRLARRPGTVPSLRTAADQARSSDARS